MGGSERIRGNKEGKQKESLKVDFWNVAELREKNKGF